MKFEHVLPEMFTSQAGDDRDMMTYRHVCVCLCEVNNKADNWFNSLSCYQGQMFKDMAKCAIPAEL